MAKRVMQATIVALLTMTASMATLLFFINRERKAKNDIDNEIDDDFIDFDVDEDDLTDEFVILNEFPP